MDASLAGDPAPQMQINKKQKRGNYGGAGLETQHFGRQTQEDYKFEASLSYIVNLRPTVLHYEFQDSLGYIMKAYLKK